MDMGSIFTKTGKGMRELADAQQLLEPVEHKILSLVNGTLCVEEICAKSGNLPVSTVKAALIDLKRNGYIRDLPKDADKFSDEPITVMQVDELDPEQAVRAWAQATRMANALQQQGYAKSSTRCSRTAGDCHVLVVDDDPLIGQMVKLVLERAGIPAQYEEDSGKVMQRLQENQKIALVLLDIMMPDLDGFTVLHLIRSDPALQRMPVAMLTAHADPQYVAEGMRAGADGYILKPIKPEKLLGYVQDMLPRKVAQA